jgi:hypothetical protein
MKTISRTQHSIEIDGVEYSVRLKPEYKDSIVTRKLADGRMVIGYLVQDGDCNNPLEDCEGIGAIHSLNLHHINRMDGNEALAILESDPDAVALSYYEHGQCLWDVQNGADISRCPDRQWDQVDFAGVWVPDDCVRESYTGQDGKTRRQWMIEQAAAACQEYTAWCNGDCWGVVVVTCEADGTMADSDECWGYVGTDYAEQTLKEQVAAAK